jgi:acyl carrier protein
MDEIEQTLVRLLEERFSLVAPAGDDASARTAIISEQLDSLELVELVLAVESVFRIRLTEDELQPSTFRDVDALAAAVRQVQARR